MLNPEIPVPVDLSEDLHMHSTFSDGANTLEEMVRAGERAGLRRICFADHVRMDTHWLPTYVDAVEAVRASTELEVLCGVEAKILDQAGRLDLPPCPEGIQAILIADHRLPLGNTCLPPADALEMLQRGETTADRIFEALVSATLGAAERAVSLGRDRVVIVAHLFSFLPKIGLDEEDIPVSLLERLAAGLSARGVLVEISERWRCPGSRALEVLRAGGVRLCASTDSHADQSVGRYRWVAEAVKALETGRAFGATRALCDHSGEPLGARLCADLSTPRSRFPLRWS